MSCKMVLSFLDNGHVVKTCYEIQMARPRQAAILVTGTAQDMTETCLVLHNEIRDNLAGVWHPMWHLYDAVSIVSWTTCMSVTSEWMDKLWHPARWQPSVCNLHTECRNVTYCCLFITLEHTTRCSVSEHGNCNDMFTLVTVKVCVQGK